LNWSGKIPSLKERLTMLVIGWRRALRQDLSSLVRMVLRLQVESRDARIAVLTSAGVAGEK
jgi:hypothetical protein